MQSLRTPTTADRVNRIIDKTIEQAYSTRTRECTLTRGFLTTGRGYAKHARYCIAGFLTRISTFHGPSSRLQGAMLATSQHLLGA